MLDGHVGRTYLIAKIENEQIHSYSLSHLKPLNKSKVDII